MFKLQSVLSFQAHMEQYLSRSICLDSISARSYKIKQMDCMIS